MRALFWADGSLAPLQGQHPHTNAKWSSGLLWLSLLAKFWAMSSPWGHENPGTPVRLGPPCLSSRKQLAWGPFESECPHERVASGRTSGNLGALGQLEAVLGGMELAGAWHSALSPC